jgi:hypothetical protein
MNRVFLVAVALVLSAPALALDIPFNVEGHCKKVASFGSPYSEMLFDSCMEMEQSAYDELKVSWADLSENMQNHCRKVASFAGPGSYSLLHSCVQMETEASSKNKARQFKY